MIGFICLFLPACFSVFLFEKILKADLDLKNVLGIYSLNNLLINGLIFALKRFVFGTADIPFISLETDTTPRAAISFIAIALISAVVLAVAEVFVAKNFKISLQEVNDEEEK